MPLSGEASLTRQAEYLCRLTPSCELRRNSIEREQKQDVIEAQGLEIAGAVERMKGMKRRRRRDRRRGRGGERRSDGFGHLRRVSSSQWIFFPTSAF